jgi:anionic cell wall polymer biosynthesis LytR-Cps2A-Psr (LCP) family protein
MTTKKKGRIAVPYIIALLVMLILVGGGAYMLFNLFGLGNNEELPELESGTSTQVTYDDSHTVLLVLDTPVEQSDVTFALMRSIPKEKKIIFTGIPTNTYGDFFGREETLSAAYSRGGISYAIDFVEQTLDIEIDRYVIFDSDSFYKICDIFGGVTYTPGVQISGIGDPDTEHYMVGTQLIKFLTYSEFKGGEMQRAYTVGSVLAAMLNQTDNQRIADSMDIYFNTMIDLVDTNITAVDYKEYKNAIKYMFEKGTAIAGYAYATGTLEKGFFIIDEDFCTSFKEDYFTDHEAATEADEEDADASGENSSENQDSEGDDE